MPLIRLENKYVSKIIQKLGYNSFDIIGCGSYGCAYNVGDGMVVKITTDVDEAINANYLRRKPKTKHLVNYYDVRKINFKNNKNKGVFYSLVLDEVIPFKTQFSDLPNWLYLPLLLIFDRVSKYYFDETLDDFLVSEYFNETLNHYILDNPSKLNKQIKNRIKGIYYNIFEAQRNDLINEMVKNRINSSIDGNIDNFGFDSDGNIVLFDLGLDTFHTFNKELKPIDITELKLRWGNKHK